VTSSVKGGRMLALHEQRQHQQQHTVNEARKLYSQRQPHATFRNEREFPAEVSAAVRLSR